MIELLPRQVSDIDFQKKKWRSKRHRTLFQWVWGLDIEVLKNWIVDELHGEWLLRKAPRTFSVWKIY
jgi:hypothetical protein